MNADRQAGRPGWKDVWVDGLKDVDECGSQLPVQWVPGLSRG